MKKENEESELDVTLDFLFTGGLQFVNSLMVHLHGIYRTVFQRKKASIILYRTMQLLREYSSTLKEDGGKIHCSSVNLDAETDLEYNLNFPKLL